jgi:hypothetical protein
VTGLVPGQRICNVSVHAVAPKQVVPAGEQKPAPNVVAGQHAPPVAREAALSHSAIAVPCCSATRPTVPTAPPTAIFIACRRDRTLRRAA